MTRCRGCAAAACPYVCPADRRRRTWGGGGGGGAAVAAVVAVAGKAEQEHGEQDTFCVACNKRFSNAAQCLNHKRSKKHLAAVKQLRLVLEAEDAEIAAEIARYDRRVAAAAAAETAAAAEVQSLSVRRLKGLLAAEGVDTSCVLEKAANIYDVGEPACRHVGMPACMYCACTAPSHHCLLEDHRRRIKCSSPRRCTRVPIYEVTNVYVRRRT